MEVMYNDFIKTCFCLFQGMNGCLHVLDLTTGLPSIIKGVEASLLCPLNLTVTTLHVTTLHVTTLHTVIL